MRSFLRILVLSLLLVTPFSTVSAAGFWDIFTTNLWGTSSSSSTKISQSDLLVGGGENSAYSDTNANIRDNFLTIIGKYVIGLLGITSVSVFLYLGYTLVTASGKEEDFKKAWKGLTYAAVGLAVIPLSYIVVKIVTGFTL